MSDSSNPLEKLVGEVLARRENDSRFRANVARGISPETDRYAYPWVLPYAQKPHDQVAYLRIAGLVASYPEIPHSTTLSLGQSLNMLSRSRSGKSIEADKPDLIASRLISFQEQEFEGAVDMLRRFFDLNKKDKIPVNYFAIARTLSRWGNGHSDASMAVRQRTLGDYYGAWSQTLDIS